MEKPAEMPAAFSRTLRYRVVVYAPAFQTSMEPCMALVKTTALARRKAEAAATGSAAASKTMTAPAKPRAASPRPRVAATREQAAERVAAATMQLASGVAEAAAAAEELRRALEQIAGGAEEAAGAAHESLATVGEMSQRFASARTDAEASRRRAEMLQAAVVEAAATIEGSLLAIETNAARQLTAVDLINRLQHQAGSIGQTTTLVADVSDQTNLLALNAAIEAARAGEKGAGFAVVADEVRALAGNTERGARDVEKLAQTIADSIAEVATRISGAAQSARAQTHVGQAIFADLATIRAELLSLLDGGTVILSAAVEADLAAREAQKGAENIAAAAEQQAAAAAEAQRAVEQQSLALEQSQQAAQALSQIAEGLGDGGAIVGGSAAMGAAAEELSATVQELSSAAAEILVAVEQISRGAEEQAAATLESNAAMMQIETSAGLSTDNARDAMRRAEGVADLLARTKASVVGVAGQLEAGLADTRAAIETLAVLEETAGRIDRAIDRIILIGVQTSMLAVSGSVEAARAGSEGRGFAIVSGDIRKLADDASQTIEGAKDAVRSIQSTIAAARRDLHLTVQAAEAEMARSKLIVERLDLVQQECAAIGTGNAAILATSDAVLTAVREVRVGTEQIAAVAQEAGAAAGQAASSAREQSNSAEDLAAAIEEIALLAAELQATG
jgi:methyl-accepting chemotaxis protein